MYHLKLGPFSRANRELINKVLKAMRGFPPGSCFWSPLEGEPYALHPATQHVLHLYLSPQEVHSLIALFPLSLEGGERMEGELSPFALHIGTAIRLTPSHFVWAGNVARIVERIEMKTHRRRTVHFDVSSLDAWVTDFGIGRWAGNEAVIQVAGWEPAYGRAYPTREDLIMARATNGEVRLSFPFFAGWEKGLGWPLGKRGVEERGAVLHRLILRNILDKLLQGEAYADFHPVFQREKDLGRQMLRFEPTVDVRPVKDGRKPCVDIHLPGKRNPRIVRIHRQNLLDALHLAVREYEFPLKYQVVVRQPEYSDHWVVQNRAGMYAAGVSSEWGGQPLARCFESLEEAVEWGESRNCRVVIEAELHFVIDTPLAQRVLVVDKDHPHRRYRLWVAGEGAVTLAPVHPSEKGLGLTSRYYRTQMIVDDPSDAI